MRTIIDIPDDKLDALTEICERENISRAEAVRRAVERFLASQERNTRESAFGAWARQVDARQTVDSLRDEWSR